MPRACTSSMALVAASGPRALATLTLPRPPVRGSFEAEYFRIPGEVRRYLGRGRQSGYAHHSCGERCDVQRRALQAT
jgi:hypothetical protein